MKRKISNPRNLAPSDKKKLVMRVAKGANAMQRKLIDSFDKKYNCRKPACSC